MIVQVIHVYPTHPHLARVVPLPHMGLSPRFEVAPKHQILLVEQERPVAVLPNSRAEKIERERQVIHARTSTNLFLTLAHKGVRLTLAMLLPTPGQHEDTVALNVQILIKQDFGAAHDQRLHTHTDIRIARIQFHAHHRSYGT